MYGKELPFTLTTIFEWPLEQYEQGELELVRPIKFNAAIHDFCNASELGKGVQDNLRKIYAAAGMEGVELEHNRDTAFSCGATSIVRDFKISTLLKTQNARYKEVKKAGMKDIAVNCPGCCCPGRDQYVGIERDRKSTRLNSSHYS